MSDTTSNPPRPVSLFTIVFLFVLFGLFFFVVRRYYHPTTTPAFVATPENLPKDLEWRATREARRGVLADTRKEEAEQATTYGWIDKDKGVVRLPIERAMELTVQKYGAKK